tara:strand:- start:738 stop:1025 length:288 start_codon:yes stop_codon:yes gene_type:complete
MKLLFTDTTSYDGLIIQLNDKQSERLEDYVLMDGSLSIFHLLKTEKDILYELENTFNIYFDESPNRRPTMDFSVRKFRIMEDFEVQAFNNIKNYA